MLLFKVKKKHESCTRFNINGFIPSPIDCYDLLADPLHSTIAYRKKLRNALWEVRADWYNLGVELEISEGTLEVPGIVVISYENESEQTHYSKAQHGHGTLSRGTSWSGECPTANTEKGKSNSISCGSVHSRLFWLMLSGCV